MNHRLRLLETFVAHDERGVHYKVCGYEHLVQPPSSPDLPQHWVPTGVAEYKLAGGEHVDFQSDGQLRVAATGLCLNRQ